MINKYLVILCYMINTKTVISNVEKNKAGKKKKCQYRWGVPYLNRMVRKGLTKVTFE